MIPLIGGNYGGISFYATAVISTTLVAFMEAFQLITTVKLVA